jgi:hypothetical protein
MTRHGRSIHMVYSKQSWPTGRPASVPMAMAFSRANVFPVTTKISAITPANTNLDPPGLTTVAAIGPPEAPYTKPHSSENADRGFLHERLSYA